MMTMSDMMKSMPMMDSGMNGMGMAMMQECMEACSAAAMAATMCADADATDGMGRCASMCMNMADVATTMMRMMMRPNGMHSGAMMSMMKACMDMGTACASECGMHDMDHCRICASACTAMVECCDRMMAAMA